MSSEVEFLKQVYEWFNARDVERVLAGMHEDVMWANGMEGGYVHGREGIRSYWKRQWEMVDPTVEPVSFAKGSNDEVTVEVHQTVRDLEGKVLLDHMVGHIFWLEDGLIRRFDIRGA
jgi:nuclear transport factor 2 (NTF2) superfamily protein